MGAMSLNSPASRMFTQPFIQAQIKENIYAPRHWPLCGAQMASNAEHFPIWWRHHSECHEPTYLVLWKIDNEAPAIEIVVRC